MIILSTLLLNAQQRKRSHSQTKFAIYKNYESRAILQHVVQNRSKTNFAICIQAMDQKHRSFSSPCCSTPCKETDRRPKLDQMDQKPWSMVTLRNLLLKALQRNRSKTKFAICKNYGSRAIHRHVYKTDQRPILQFACKLWIKNVRHSLYRVAQGLAKKQIKDQNCN